MEDGCRDSAGNKRSSSASTAKRSSSKKRGSFIGSRRFSDRSIEGSSRFVFALRFERLSDYFSVRFLQQNLYSSFRFFQLLLAFARKANAFFEQLQGFIERQL